MANTFTVTTAELNQKAGELRANNRNLTTQIENLRGQHRALYGMWEGDACVAGCRHRHSAQHSF